MYRVYRAGVSGLSGSLSVYRFIGLSVNRFIGYRFIGIGYIGFIGLGVSVHIGLLVSCRGCIPEGPWICEAS